MMGVMIGNTPSNVNNTHNGTHGNEDPLEDDPCAVFFFTINGVFGLAVLLIGLTGNSLSLLILRRIDRKSVTFFLLRALAIVDITYLFTYGMLIVIPEYLLYTEMEKAYYSEFQYVLYILFPWSSAAQTCTIWLTSLLTLHR